MARARTRGTHHTHMHNGMRAPMRAPHDICTARVAAGAGAARSRESSGTQHKVNNGQIKVTHLRFSFIRYDAYRI